VFEEEKTLEVISMLKMRWQTLVILTGMLLVMCALILGSIAKASPQSAGGSGYKLANKFTLGGPGGWDYLEIDPATHRVFISRGTHVMVVDPESGKVLGDIPNTMGVHGIALAPEFNHGFTSNGMSGTATMFDMTTLQALGEPKTEKGPDAIIYDPGSKRVFTMNGAGNSATAIDAKTGEVAGSVALGGAPEFAAADGKGHVFANLEDKSALVEIDSKALTLMNTWPLAPCDSPSGLAIDTKNNRLVVGCHNKMMAFVDGSTGKVVGTVAIGTGVDANKFDPGTGFAFASCGDGTITVAHEDSPDKFTVVDTIQTQNGARTMAVDYANHNVVTVTAQFEAPPAVPPAPPAAAPPAGGAPGAPPAARGGYRRPAMVPDTFTLLVFKK
jgi:DNA-binding beta-propeller fold protein YncE